MAFFRARHSKEHHTPGAKIIALRTLYPNSARLNLISSVARANINVLRRAALDPNAPLLGL